MSASNPTTIARDATSAAATWRPQQFIEGGGKIGDPIIEPLWTGLRVLALVDGGSVTIRDIDGDPVDEFPEAAAELATANQAERLIVAAL